MVWVRKLSLSAPSTFHSELRPANEQVWRKFDTIQAHASWKTHQLDMLDMRMILVVQRTLLRTMSRVKHLCALLLTLRGSSGLPARQSWQDVESPQVPAGQSAHTAPVSS